MPFLISPNERFLIVDDHYIVRMGLTALINSEPDMEVVGAARMCFKWSLTFLLI